MYKIISGKKKKNFRVSPEWYGGFMNDTYEAAKIKWLVQEEFCRGS
jgi:hypothetical protein